MTSRSVSSRWRAGAATAAVVVALVSALVPAVAASKSTEKKEAGKPNLVASFGDWNVFVGQAGKGKICYVLAQPKTREPEAKRESGYAFISDRPAEGVRNEVSFIMGFEVAGGAAAAGKADAKVDKADMKPTKAKAKADSKSKTAAAIVPVATVGEESFDLLPKGANLWVKNAARESALIAEMKKGESLVVKAAALKGEGTTDTFSLTGFSQAMDRLAKECPGKG